MFFAYIISGLILAFVICLISGKERPWIAQTAFAALIVGSLVTASKVATLADGVYISVAVGLYSMTFLLTDFLGEIHGKAVAMRSVAMAAIASIVVLFAIQFGLAVPGAPFWANQEAMDTALGSTSRILIASLIAFIAAQLADVSIFDILKKLTNGEHLWFRNNASTFVGQTIDTVLFFGIAFWGVVPNLPQLIVTTCLVKFAIALLDTPVIYVVRRLVDKSPVGSSSAHSA